MLLKICSAAMVLLLVMDPVGNLAVFVPLLKKTDSKGWVRIILRESVFALLILLIFLLSGDFLLKFLQVSQTSLVFAGGVILFLISLKMVFGSPIMHEESRTDFFLVPIAIPLIAGPSTIAMVILTHSTVSLAEGSAALLIAWTVSTLILLSGRFISSRLGSNVLNAMESLVGFILAMVSIEMLIKGLTNVIRSFSA